MRNIVLATFILALFAFSNIHAQKIYSSNQIKLIFSTAPNISRADHRLASPMRFTAFFNYSTVVHVDLTKHLGVSIGLEIKNIGLTLKDSSYKTKHRAYALGVPVYLRLGNMSERWYFLAGAQYDYLFAYKEKVFIDDIKIKRHSSNSVRPFIPSVFVGFKAKSGATLSIHYMLQNFFSDDYRFKDKNDVPLAQGYDNSQLLYFSIGFMGDLDRKKTKRKTPPPQDKQEVFSRNQ